jgi:hypothetical protein
MPCLSCGLLAVLSRVGSEETQGAAGHAVTLEVERIVNRRMSREEALNETS